MVEEDRISSLPDCLLVEILSRLPDTKQAIRTGTLSKRWQHVWNYVTTLNFSHSEGARLPHDLCALVDKTLTQCSSRLNKFELCISYKVGYEWIVNRWIHYAINRNLQELTLLLSTSETRFLLHQIFYTASCFTHLMLTGCEFNDSWGITWKNLKSLYITFMELDEDMVENILYGSPVLETITLEDCYGFKRLDITSKSVKNLVLFGYSGPYGEDFIDLLEINAPYILTLKIKGYLKLWKLLLLDVFSLVQTNLNFKIEWHSHTSRKERAEEMLKGFILKLPHVKELKFGMLCFKILSRLEGKGFVYPSNMKFPDVTSDSDSHESIDGEVQPDHDPEGFIMTGSDSDRNT